MMKGRLGVIVSIAAICTVVFLIGAVDQTTKDALKVEHLLKTIEMHPPRSGGNDLTAEVTETELNAYIAYRLAQEKKQLINSLTVGLMDNNHIQGNVRCNAQRLNLSALLGDDPDFAFKGLVHSRDGAARLELISLQLNGQPVSPSVLEFILSAAALYYGTEAPRIDDWYALPKGIKRATVSKGRTVLYY